MPPQADPPAQASHANDKAPARPAMPSGTVRARRIHPRYRKGKARAEANLEPAVPTATEFKPTNDSKPRQNKPHRQAHTFQMPQSQQEQHLVQQPLQQTVPIKVHPISQQQQLPPTAHIQQPSPLQQNPHAAQVQQSQQAESQQQQRQSPPPQAPKQPEPPLQNQPNTPAVRSSSPPLIIDVSPQSQRSSAAVHPSDESIPASKVAVSQLVNDGDLDDISSCVANIRISSDAIRSRPLICQDITNSNADTLRISRLPRGVTYDRLLSMVEPFGEVEDLAWTASDPYVCDVTYRDPAAAREAKHFLGDALVGNDSEPPLKAELRSRDPGAQLFVGDLTPDVTEEMLEATFSELVGEPVSALLKRDPDSFSPIGYGFLSFKSESSANFALVAGHRVKIGNACVRVGRAERNTYLYVSDLAPNVSLDEVKNLFGKFGSLVEEDTIIVRRSYAFVRYKNRGAAEKAKRTLDKTDLKGRLSVRYAEAEPLKACVAVQFHSSVPRPPNSLRDLLSATFSKHGNCSVEIPRLQNGLWRKVAFVTFHGEPIAANLAALEAVQSIRFVSSLPVCCQFARELIPRLPSRGMHHEKFGASDVGRSSAVTIPEKATERNFLARKKAARRTEHTSGSGNIASRQGQQVFDQHANQYGNENTGQQGAPDFVPVYVPITALQHPSQVPSNAGHQSSEGEFPGYQQHWQHRMMIANSNGITQNLNPAASHFTPNYNSFAPLQDRGMRW